MEAAPIKDSLCKKITKKEMFFKSFQQKKYKIKKENKKIKS